MDPSSDNRGVIDNILREYNVEGASYQTGTYQTSPGQQITIEKKTTTFEPGNYQYQYSSYEPGKETGYRLEQPAESKVTVSNYNYQPDSYSYQRPTEEVIRYSNYGGQVQTNEVYKPAEEVIRYSNYGGQVQASEGYKYDNPSVTVVREEVVKRSGYGGQVQAPPQQVDYRVETISAPIQTDFKTFEVKTDFDKTGIQPYDYRSANFATFEYKPTEYKPVEYQPVEYKPAEYSYSTYQPAPQSYKVTEYVVNDYKPAEYKPEPEPVVRFEGVKRAGVTTTVTETVTMSHSEQEQIRLMGEEIERIRLTNIDSFNRYSRLQEERRELLIRIENFESELIVIRGGGGGNNRELQLRIEEKQREIDLLKSQAGTVRVDRQDEVNEINRQIKDKEYEIDVLKKKIDDLEKTRTKYINELNANKEALIKNKQNGTTWCC